MLLRAREVERAGAVPRVQVSPTPPGGTGRLLAAAATRAEATACLEREVVARAVTAGGKLGDGGTAGGGYDVALYESFRPARHIFRLHSLPRCSRAAARRRLRLRPALAASHDGVDACASGSASANTCGVVYVGLALIPLAARALGYARWAARAKGAATRQGCRRGGLVTPDRDAHAPPPVPRAPGTRQARAARAARARGASSRSCALVRARLPAQRADERVRYEYMRDISISHPPRR